MCMLNSIFYLNCSQLIHIPQSTFTKDIALKRNARLSIYWRKNLIIYLEC